jgi:RimJ/RimL family protein N-acetyltransferase
MLLKPFTKEILVENALITCDEDNSASRRTIEKCGGELIGIVKDVDVPEENCKKDCCYYLLSLLNPTFNRLYNLTLSCTIFQPI